MTKCPWKCGQTCDVPLSVFLERQGKHLESIQKEPSPVVSFDGGEFLMGSTRYMDCNPIHKVFLSAFHIVRSRVTLVDWIRIMRSKPGIIGNLYEHVWGISWYDAIEYCNRRSVLDGLTPCYSGEGDDIACDWDVNGYRLPSEAESEYIRRCDEVNNDYEYEGGLSRGVITRKEAIERGYELQGVRKYHFLEYHGDILDWCWDRYQYDYYSNSPQKDPRGPDSGTDRSARGGRKNSAILSFDPTVYRFHADPKKGGFSVRLARSKITAE